MTRPKRSWREAYTGALDGARINGGRRRVFKNGADWWTWTSTTNPRRETPHPTPTEEGNG